MIANQSRLLSYASEEPNMQVLVRLHEDLTKLPDQTTLDPQVTDENTHTHTHTKQIFALDPRVIFEKREIQKKVIDFFHECFEAVTVNLGKQIFQAIVAA